MIKHAALLIALPLLAQPLPINTRVALQDSSPKHLIAFMGDSYASGEGAPQRGANKWDAEPCHRSEENGRYRAAQLLGSLVPSRTVVTSAGLRVVDDFQVTDVSCSGATITSGILGPYTGVERMRPEGPGPKADLKPQIDQVESWMKAAPRNRESIDTLVISIGGNDVGFAKIIATCMDPTHPTNCNEDSTLQTLMNIGNPFGGTLIGYARLRQAFVDMDQKIREKLNPKRIILVAYPNGVRDEFGQLCDQYDENFSLLPIFETYVPSIGALGGATVHIKAAEASFIETQLIGRVNNERRAIAADLGWQFINIQNFTKTHGYCAAQPWFNTPKTSWNNQDDFTGTAHPNAKGYKVYENFLLRELARAHDIHADANVTGNHEEFAFTLTRRGSASRVNGDSSDLFGGLPYTIQHERNFTARMKYLLNPNPDVFTNIRLEVSTTDFAFNPTDVRVVAPSTGLIQEGMLSADFPTNAYADNQLIFVRWRLQHTPFWNATAAPETSYSTVKKYRVNGFRPLLPAE